ncbi:MAG: hypothetical protein ACK5OH_00270, partial [bacterium]
MFGRKIKRIEPIEPVGEEPEVEIEAGLSLEDLGNAYAQAANALGAESSGSFDGDPPVASERSIGVHHEEAEDFLEAPSVSETDGLLVTTESVLESILFLGTNDNR